MQGSPGGVPTASGPGYQGPGAGYGNPHGGGGHDGGGGHGVGGPGGNGNLSPSIQSKLPALGDVVDAKTIDSFIGQSLKNVSSLQPYVPKGLNAVGDTINLGMKVNNISPTGVAKAQYNNLMKLINPFSIQSLADGIVSLPSDIRQTAGDIAGAAKSVASQNADAARQAGPAAAEFSAGVHNEIRGLYSPF
jgi:hypothetical protein